MINTHVPTSSAEDEIVKYFFTMVLKEQWLTVTQNIRVLQIPTKKRRTKTEEEGTKSMGIFGRGGLRGVRGGGGGGGERGSPD